MSGNATSFTQAIPLGLVPHVRRGLDEEDLDMLDDARRTKLFVYGGSRNNHMESCIQQVLDAFPHAGIAYLCRHHVVLECRELSEAILDLRSFLSLLYSKSDACAEIFNQHLFSCTGQDIRDEIDRLPRDVDDAIAAFESLDSDKDDHYSLLRFLNAHAAILDAAQKEGMGAVYCLWLYGA